MDLWSTVKRSVTAATTAAQTMMGLKQPHEEFLHWANATVTWIDKEAALPHSDAGNRWLACDGCAQRGLIV